MPAHDTRQHRALGAVLLVMTSAVGCTSPEPRPLASADVARSVMDRASPTSAQLRDALDLYDTPPLGLELSSSFETHDDAFWHAHALAFHPDVRAARRTWRARRAAIDAGGNPEPVVVNAMVDDFSDTSRKQELAATVDLFGILGFGSAPAERNELTLIADVAHSELEETVWHALFAVDTARLQLAAATQREHELAVLADEARQDVRSLEILHDVGRVSTNALELARVTVASLEVRLADLATDSLRAREDLAISVGLAPDADALTLVVDPWAHRSLPTPGPIGARPTSSELFDRLPRLRAATRDYALAEARVRSAAASAWPTLRLGPSLEILPDERLLGGVISFDVPWPSAVDARVEAALEDRDAAREALEDEFVEALANVHARDEELRLALRVSDESDQLDLMARTWSAVRATVSVRHDFDAVENWAGMLRNYAQLIADDQRGAERLPLAALAYREAAGLLPGLSTMHRGEQR